MQWTCQLVVKTGTPPKWGVTLLQEESSSPTGWLDKPLVLRPSIVFRRRSSSVRNVLWLNGASWSKSYYWEPIGSRIYEKSIGTKMNDLDLRLEVVSKSCQPLRYIRPWIPQKPLEIYRLGSKRPPIGNGIWAIKW